MEMDTPPGSSASLEKPHQTRASGRMEWVQVLVHSSPWGGGDHLVIVLLGAGDGGDCCAFWGDYPRGRQGTLRYDPQIHRCTKRGDLDPQLAHEGFRVSHGVAQG